MAVPSSYVFALPPTAEAIKKPASLSKMVKVTKTKAPEPKQELLLVGDLKSEDEFECGVVQGVYFPWGLNVSRAVNRQIIGPKF